MKFLVKLFFVLFITSLAPIIQAIEKVAETRIEEIAERGKHVMPFNLERTVHVFSKKEYGGLQQVVVKKPLIMNK